MCDDTKNGCVADYAGVCLSVFIVVFSLAATKTPLIDFPASSDLTVLERQRPRMRMLTEKKKS